MGISKNSNIYDFAVIGGGFTGLVLAHQLELSGYHVGLFEESDRYGGVLRSTDVSGCNFEAQVDFIPSKTENIQSLSWLGNLLSLDIVGESIPYNLFTYEDGHFKKFLGFGNRKFSSLSILNNFNYNEKIVLLNQPSDWIKKIESDVIGDLHPRSVITKIEPSLNSDFDGMTIEVNGSKSVLARRVIFTLSPSHLLNIFPDNLLASKTKQKIGKSRQWTSVSIYLQHTEDFEFQDGLHVLYGSKDEFEPTLGHFFYSQSDEKKIFCSKWMSLLPSDIAEDSEAIANLIREMKKQIKRGYPKILELSSPEKIIVSDHSFGNVDLGLKEVGVLQEIPQFYLAHHSLVSTEPLIGSLMIAEQAISWARQSIGQRDVEPNASI